MDELWPQSRPDTSRGKFLLYLCLILLALVIALAFLAPGAVSACSSDRSDPCLLPPMLILVLPGLMIGGIALGLAIVLPGRWGVPFLIAAILGFGWRAIDSFYALQSEGRGADYDAITDSAVSRPTAGGALSAIAIAMLIGLLLIEIVVRCDPRPSNGESTSNDQLSEQTWSTERN